MHHFPQQSPDAASSAGNRTIVTSGFVRNSGRAARGYGAAVAGLGLMIGTSIALTGCRAHPPEPPKPSTTASAHPAAVSPLPAVSPVPVPSLLSQINGPKKAAPASPQVKRVSVPSPKKPAEAPMERSIPRILLVKHVSEKHDSEEHISEKHDAPVRRPYVAPISPAAPAPAPMLDPAPARVATATFFLRIEGDLTVASYDEASGDIGSYEGSSFVLDPKAADGIPWQDFPFNVHYRCEESGECILTRGGDTATARMTR